MSISVTGDRNQRNSVAIAVNGSSVVEGGNGSRRAVRWAIENFSTKADRFVLVHVMPAIISIPTPSGNYISITEFEESVVKLYKQDAKSKAEEVFIPYKKLCKSLEVETLVLEGHDPAVALLRYVTEAGINVLVLGSCPKNCIMRKLKGHSVPTNVMRSVNSSCDIYVISKRKIISKLNNSSSTYGISLGLGRLPQQDHGEGSSVDVKSAGLRSRVRKTFSMSSISEASNASSYAFAHGDTKTNTSVDTTSNLQGLQHNFKTGSVDQIKSLSSAKSEQSEVEQLQQELDATLSMYERACEELIHAQNEVQFLNNQIHEEARRVNVALDRKETLSKIVAEERAKHLQALNEVEKAKDLLAKQTYERQVAEMNAMKESSEKQQIIDALLSSDRRYRRYTREKLETATNFFSESNVIGEGGYGKVYKCYLDHTPVAVKVIRSDVIDKREEFLKEVEVLSQIRHPHMVLLLGACPENGCLVYEYLENGSLEDFIFHRNGKPSLPWYIRFRIVFEVACGLAFLHNSKPEPIVHRDLKPGNILLDKSYVSKIGDVGLAKLISDVAPENVTEYRDSILAGTLYYMDPEYQRTGTIRPKSDLYAFGVIILQLLTAHHPKGLVLKVENALKNNSLANILDNSITDWPLSEVEELVRMALKCSKLRCRDRPELETEVLPLLKRLVDVADAYLKSESNGIHTPSNFFCPILEDVMEDPYIAGDGFTYEHRAIKAWLEKHNVSPVTKLNLPHSLIIPNHTLRSAILHWRSALLTSKPI